MTFVAWPEIEAFHNIRKYTHAHPEILNGQSVVHYRPKVKLHGTNAAVQILADGTVIAQSREGIITPEKDNAGFARWVKANEEAWRKAFQVKSLWDNSIHHVGFIVYGEWIGPGIQKGVAVSEIPKKSFAVFAARPFDEKGNPMDVLLPNPNGLALFVENIPDTYVIPWYNEGIKIDWSKSSEELAKDVETINAWVQAIEANDPWVEATFGVKGTGEGLVFYPYSKEHLAYTDFSNLVFKAKGEKHKNIATAKPAQVDASTAASVDAFVAMVLTEARLEQGARAILGEHKHEDKLSCLFCTTGALTYDMKNTGKFVNWVSADVEKETQDELAASNLTFKQVQKALSEKARAWYIGKAKAL